MRWKGGPMAFDRGFKEPTLPEAEVRRLEELGRLCRGDILRMTTLAGSGHPGGSLSSIDMALVVYAFARVDPATPLDPERDFVVVSHGHVSPAVYASLGRTGFFDVEEAVLRFRRLGSPFEGHVEHGVPGVEWNTGNLGQGLSAACGFALSKRLFARPGQVFCLMSDGEHAKGQVAEARRFASKFGLNNVTVLIDYNKLQICGNLDDVMPQNTAGGYRADGWEVLEVDGHRPDEIYAALHRSVHDADHRYAVLAHTTMGKGVPFMEGEHVYHGKPLSEEECGRALEALGLPANLGDLREAGKNLEAGAEDFHCPIVADFRLEGGDPETYDTGEKMDNRSAFGAAVLDLARRNRDEKDVSPMAVLDCDLAGSVKTSTLETECPGAFFQSGVAEHNAATVAGALSAQGVVTFFADFGVFGVDETYNQHRLNDINWANVKLACTHLGLDVGEDGKTHQCIDYLGLLRSLFGFKAVVPADPNQTDRVVRTVASSPGMWFIGMGRSKTPILDDGEGKPFFSGDYVFRYGAVDEIREGRDATILAFGPTVARALTVRTLLSGDGIDVGVWNASCPNHPDRDAVLTAAKRGPILVYEDHHAETGLGSVVARILAEAGVATRFRILGVTRYGGSGTPDALYREAGLSTEHAASALRELTGVQGA